MGRVESVVTLGYLESREDADADREQLEEHRAPEPVRSLFPHTVGRRIPDVLPVRGRLH